MLNGSFNKLFIGNVIEHQMSLNMQIYVRFNSLIEFILPSVAFFLFFGSFILCVLSGGAAWRWSTVAGPLFGFDDDDDDDGKHCTHSGSASAINHNSYLCCEM